MDQEPRLRQVASPPLVVGVDAHVLTGKYQGSRTWLAEMLQSLGRLDSDTRYVLYSDDPSATARAFPFANFQHRALGISRPAPRLLLYWPYVQLRDRLDFLITQYMAPLLFPGRQIVVVHDVLFESHPQFFPPVTRLRNRLLVRRSAQRARLVLTVSEFSRREIASRYGIPAERILVTPNGAPRAMTPTTRRAAADRPYILAVGRIEPRKNLATLLAAHRQTRHRGLRLIVVGREDFGGAELVRAMAGLPDVTHLRDVPEDVLDGLYRGASALVFPSLAEGFGLPLVEALARGTPVICSNATAMPEVCGRFGRYFDPGAADAVARLAQLIDETLAGPPSMDGVAEHLAEFSWDRSARRLLNALHHLRVGTAAPAIDAQMDVSA